MLSNVAAPRAAAPIPIHRNPGQQNSQADRRILRIAPHQMSYDLARLRLNGRIARLEHTNTQPPTPEGRRAAVFYTKAHARLLRPLLAANAPPAPTELRHALATIDRHVRGYIDKARLGNAA